MRDRQIGTNYALTAVSSGTGVNSAEMTPDGQYVAFIGVAPGTDGTKLYVWNAASRARVYTNATPSLNTVAISADGNRLAFASPTQIFVADRAAGTTAQISSNSTVSEPAFGFNRDGQWLVYRATNQVFLYRFPSGASQLVSRNPNTLAPANGRSSSPVISADGRFVAYSSAAGDLVNDDTNGVPDVFVYDRLNDSTTRLSVSAAGHGGGNNRSQSPVFSGDGRTLVFRSWAKTWSPPISTRPATCSPLCSCSLM